MEACHGQDFQLRAFWEQHVATHTTVQHNWGAGKGYSLVSFLEGRCDWVRHDDKGSFVDLTHLVQEVGNFVKMA